MTRRELAKRISQLMPNILRGTHLDYFIKRGLTQTQFLTLLAIHSYGHCRMSSLARSLHVRMPTMTGVVERLVRGRFVKRTSQPEDRRTVWISLLPKGLESLKGFEAIVEKRWHEVLQFLAPEEINSFGRAVNQLLDQFKGQAQ